MRTLLIRGSRIFDGTANPSAHKPLVLVRDGRIAAVGEEAEARAAEADRVLDCRGQTLLPGLIDCHNHLSLDPGLDNYLHRMTDPVPELTIRAVGTMAVDLDAGVTTSRCLGDKEFLDVECKKAVASGWLKGPRILAATRGLRAPHGHGFVGYAFGGVENIRQAVRENIGAGADLIKIYLTGTLRGPKGLPCSYSREEVQTLVDEAHRAGLPVATHCIGGPGLDLALETGIDVIEHGYFISDDQIEALGRADRWLVMTPSIFFTEARIETLPPALIQPHREQREEVGRRMAACVKADIKYALGTDGMHGGLAREARYLTDFGAPASRAILAVTADAARVCGLAHEIGTIEKGKRGDIIGVSGHPVEDISALERVLTVVKDGLVVKEGAAAP